MPRLVAVDAILDRGFVDALRRAWDAGDAVFPLDPRLPGAARVALVEAMRVGEPVEEGDALVVATSGSTGEPKGAVLTHAAVAASSAATARRLKVDPVVDTWLACLPPAHMGGLAVITRSLAAGTGLTFNVDDPAATLTSVVPTQLDRMDVSRFRLVLLGGSADWRSDRPPNVVRTYGLTETASSVAYDGRMLDGIEVRVDGGGQVWLRGPTLLRCYRDNTDPKNADGWYPTGDAGRLEPDGRLHVEGRMGDVIVTGGEKVWPTPVEAALRTHPGVAEVAVAGRPDDEWGSRVVAFVVPADPATPPTLDALREWAKERLPPWCAPRQLVLRPFLPRTPSGKIRRPAL